MQRLKAYFADFWRFRYLLQNLIGRDIKLKYRRSVLGIAWSVLNPLLMNVVMVAVFSVILPSKIEHFPVYLIIGQLLFNFFSEATNSAMSSMLAAAPLIKKVYIPKYIFTIEKVTFALVNCLFSFVALLIVVVFTGAPLHATAILALFPLFLLYLFSLGIGLLLAAMTVFFRDIMHMWAVFLTALTYFSAIFYDPSTMFESTLLRTVVNMNPIYWYITAFRANVLQGTLMTNSMVLVCSGCSFVALAIGLLFFRSQQDKFVLHI